MKKRFNPKKIKRSQKKRPYNLSTSLEHIAQTYTGVMHKLTPLIKAQSIPPGPALTLVACYTDAVITGNDSKPTHSMSGQQILEATNLLIYLWKQGIVRPNTEYPYTLEQTLADIDQNKEEDEG